MYVLEQSRQLHSVTALPRRRQCPAFQASSTRQMLPGVFVHVAPQNTSIWIATRSGNMWPYRYRPLKHTNSIRILVLHPSPDHSDPLICTIQHARLSDPSLKYEAISYTWGDTTHRHAIYFQNGRRELQIGSNCCGALQRLRQKHRDTFLWIDAICIDQENVTERSSQVRIMDEIFRTASGVTVYLGEQTMGSRIIFEELAEAESWISQGQIHKRPAPKGKLVKELEILFQRPWFSRVWVLQEVCHRASITFICGDACASAEALLQLIHGYRNNLVIRDTRPLVLDLLCRFKEDFSNPQFDLWNMLYRSRKCLATDARDRVFALKSLLGSGQFVMDSLVDYTKSFEDTCFGTAMFLVPVVGLWILTAIRHPHEMDMPSWTPDWSQNLPLNYKHFNTKPSWNNLAYGFGQPEGMRQDTRMVYDRDYRRFPKLFVTGCQYARIVSRSGTFHFTSLDDARKQRIHLCHALDSLREYFGLEGTADDYVKDKQLNQDILQAMSSTDAWSLSLYLSRGHTALPKFLNSSIDNFNDDENVQQFFESLQRCRIALTESGELAIIADKIENQDVLCVLSGTAAPCALRRVEDADWTLICGDCFIFSRDLYHAPFWDFKADDYLVRNRDRLEEFRIR